MADGPDATTARADADESAAATDADESAAATDADESAAATDADGSTGDRPPGEPDGQPTLPADPLLAWALGGFHAALLVAAGVLALHAAGTAGDLLQGLSTVVGLAAYLGLWASTWWTARSWLRDGGTSVDALKWGTANALAVFAAGYAVVFLPFAASDPSTFTFLALALVVGAAVAVTVGALAGGLLGLLDHALIRIGRRFVE